MQVFKSSVLLGEAQVALWVPHLMKTILGFYPYGPAIGGSISFHTKLSDPGNALPKEPPSGFTVKALQALFSTSSLRSGRIMGTLPFGSRRCSGHLVSNIRENCALTLFNYLLLPFHYSKHACAISWTCWWFVPQHPPITCILVKRLFNALYCCPGSFGLPLSSSVDSSRFGLL